MDELINFSKLNRCYEITSIGKSKVRQYWVYDKKLHFILKIFLKNIYIDKIWADTIYQCCKYTMY